jgi:hypothetical protein
MKNLFLTAVLILTTFFSWSQDAVGSKEIASIEVIGTGELDLVPDEIYISFTLKERFDGKKKIEIDDQEKEMKAQLTKKGFDLSNLALADASSDYLQVKWKKKDVIAEKNYVLKTSNTGEVAKAFETLDQISALNAAIQRVDHSELEKYKKEVKMMAIKDAKAKASSLLSAIDEVLGKPILIQERENYTDYQPIRRMNASPPMLMSAVEFSSMKQEESNEIGFEKIKLNYKVFAKFAIK